MVNPVTTSNQSEMPLGQLGGSRMSIIEDRLYIEFNVEKTVARIHDLSKRFVYEFTEIDEKANAQLLTQYFTRIAMDTKIDGINIKQCIDDFFNELDHNVKNTEEMASLPELFKKKAEKKTGRSLKALIITMLVIGIATMLIGGVLCAYPSLLPLGISLIALGFITVSILPVYNNVKTCQHARKADLNIHV